VLPSLNYKPFIILKQVNFTFTGLLFSIYISFISCY